MIAKALGLAPGAFMGALMVLELVRSLAFGMPGSYGFNGMSIEFFDAGNSIISKIALGVFGGHYLNALVHELGHNLAYEYVIGRYGKIDLYSDGAAECSMRPLFFDVKPTSASNILIDLCGPLANSAFAVIRAIGIRKCIHQIRRHRNGAPLSKFQSIIFTILKVQNYLCAIYPLLELSILVKNYNYSMDKMAFGSDFMQIYYHGGIPAVIGSSILLGAISALAIKIMRNDIPVDQPLRVKVYTNIMAAIDRARQATYEVNLIAMGVMKSAIDFVGSPLVVQMNAKRLGTPNHS